MADIATLNIVYNIKGAKEAANANDSLARSSKAVESSSRSAQSAHDSYLKKIGNTAPIQGMTRQVKGLAAAFLSFGAISSTLRISEDLLNLQSRLEITTGSTRNAAVAFGKLRQISESLGVSIDSTGKLFSKLAAVGGEQGISLDRLIRNTDLYAKTVKISGANAQEAAASTLQYAQALGRGVLNGDEFRSISEGNVMFLKLLAEGLRNLGIEATTGELKKMGEEGKLTTDLIVRGLEAVGGKIDLLSGKLTGRFSQAWQNLKTAAGLALFEIDSFFGISSAISAVFQKMADAVNFLAKGFVFLTQSIKAGTYELLNFVGIVSDDTLAKKLEEIRNKITSVFGGGEFEGATPAAPKIIDEAALKQAQKQQQMIQDMLMDFNMEITALENQILTYGKKESVIARINKQQEIQNMLLKNGITLNKNQKDAVGELIDQYERKVEEFEKVKRSIDSANQAIEGLNNSFGSAIEDMILGTKKLSESVRQLGLDIAKTIYQQTIGKSISESVGGLLGGLGGLLGGSSFGSYGPQLPGFATGGSFMVGGAGGTDSQTVAFRATPGERVTVQTPGQQANGGGMVFNIDARGAENGVEQKIVAAIRQLRSEIPNIAVTSVTNARARNPQLFGA